MDTNEITYNFFYLLLKNKFRKKYKLALSNCWTICVPCSDSLRGLTITEDFLDDHILKPHAQLPSRYVSTNDSFPRVYNIRDTVINAACEEELSESKESCVANIISIERGYNKKFQAYNMLVIDRPLNTKYRISQEIQDNRIQVNRGITCYKEALDFLSEPPDKERCSLEKLTSDLRKFDLTQFDSAETLSAKLQELTRRYWASTMRKQPLELQRDAQFQKLLSTSIEVFIMHNLHDRIYSLLTDALEQDDFYLRKKIDQLIHVGITPDQLGAKESLAISLPAAIVELATLDARTGPLEKLLCLKSTLDLIIAEIKGALADIEMEMDEESIKAIAEARRLFHAPSAVDLIPLLNYVIVKSRPTRLVTDLHYIQNFLWSLSPQDGLTYSLVTFEAAVSALFKINAQELPPRSHKVKTELPIGELLEVISGTDKEVTPIDRQIHQLAAMLEKCTQNQEHLI